MRRWGRGVLGGRGVDAFESGARHLWSRCTHQELRIEAVCGSHVCRCKPIRPPVAGPDGSIPNALRGLLHIPHCGLLYSPPLGVVKARIRNRRGQRLCVYRRSGDRAVHGDPPHARRLAARSLRVGAIVINGHYAWGGQREVGEGVGVGFRVGVAVVVGFGVGVVVEGVFMGG